MTAQMAMAALGIVAATAMAFAVRTERPARWLAVAVGLAVLPGTLATVGGRVLTIALFASTALVALVLDRGGRVVRDRQRPLHTRAIAGLAVCALGLLHVGGASSVRVVIASDFARIALEEERQADLVPPCPDVMVIVAASDAAISTYVPLRLRLRGRPPQRYHVLSVAPTDHRIDTIAARSFELTSARANGNRSLWERLFRSGPVPAGTHVELPGLDVTVLEDRDGAPTRVRFVFDGRLDSSRICFLEWNNNRLSRLPPLNARDVVDIPHEPGPIGF
jgi:hypothetical protein